MPEALLEFREDMMLAVVEILYYNTHSKDNMKNVYVNILCYFMLFMLYFQL